MMSKAPEARREEIISGPLMNVLFRLSLPTMGAAFLDTIYSFLDSIWLGGIGSSSISAPMLTLTVLWLMFSIFSGIINGAFPYIAQNRGAGKDEDARKAAGQAMLLSMIIMEPLVATFLLLLPYIATFFGLKGAFREDFLAYARIVIFSDIALGLAQMCLGLIRLWGYPEVALYVRVPFVLLNAVLDPFLIYGWGPFPRLEVRGAAIATLIAEVLEGAVALYLIVYGKVGINMRLKHLKPDVKLIKGIVKIGTPMGITNFTEASGFFVLTTIISRIGEVAITTWTIYDKITELFWWMINSLGNASAIIIGQSIGANKFKGAEDTIRMTLLLGFIISLIGTVVIAIFHEQVFAMFLRNPEDPLRPLVLRESLYITTIFGASLPVLSISFTAMAPFYISGRTKYPMYVALARLWMMRVPLTFLFGIVLGYGTVGAWTGMSLSNFLAGALGYAILRTGKWKYRVIETPGVSTGGDVTACSKENLLEDHK